MSALASHSLNLALASLAVALVACGARASLDDRLTTTRSSGTGGGIAGTGGTGGNGSTGSTGNGAGGSGGTGGTPAGCATLAWVGEPVFVPVFEGMGLLHLVRTTVGEHALAFDLAVPDATLLESMSLTAWWTAWPPPLGPLDTADPLSWQLGGHVVSRGEPGALAFATAGGAQMRLGQAKPGEMANALAKWSSTGGEVKTLARNNGGAYLVGHGPEGGLTADILPAFVSSPTPIKTGALGCVSSHLAAAAVGLGDDAFLVASTNDTPFDDCLDPSLPGPPTVVQLLVVSTTGNVQKGGFIQETGPVLDLQLSGRIGGAWLTYRVDGDPTVHIRAVDASGQLGDDAGLFGNPLYGDAVVAFNDGFAHAFSFPGAPDAQAPPFVALLVRSGPLVVQVAKPIATPVRPVGRPAVATSDDGRSILVAFKNDAEDGTTPSVGLLRADCAP